MIGAQIKIAGLQQNLYNNKLYMLNEAKQTNKQTNNMYNSKFTMRCFTCSAFLKNSSRSEPTMFKHLNHHLQEYSLCLAEIGNVKQGCYKEKM